MDDKKQDKQPMRTSTKWAIGVTVVWLGGIAAYVWWKWCTFVVMEPNSLGDFLAGTMSPLAFFWLIAGYHQQGEELRLNTKALKAQLRELELQVKATKDMGSSAKKQADIAEENHKFEKQKYQYEAAEKKEIHKRKICPAFEMKFRYKASNALTFRFFNYGGDAFDIRLTNESGGSPVLEGDYARVKKNEERELSFFLEDEYQNGLLVFSVHCSDEDRYQHEFKFTLIPESGGGYVATEEYVV